MAQQPSAAELKALQREHWQKAAPGYSKWVIESNAVPEVLQKYADTLESHFGRDTAVKVLDLASASGEPAITLAKRLPAAHIVSTDLESGYQQLGQARARKAGVQDRVTFETADAEELHNYSDSSFDAVTCSFGLMFVSSLSSALNEIYRVLKPGGLLVVTVWKSLPRWPYMHTFIRFCSGTRLELDPEAMKGTPPSLATKFGDDAHELLEGLQAAHFREIVRGDAAGTYTLPAEGWWQAMLEMPLPLARILEKRKREGQEDAFETAQSKLKEALTSKGFLQQDGSLHIGNNQCHFITAKK
ncbi:hypothetical protein N2152v2_005764 [Parachlorella kessleri]